MADKLNARQETLAAALAAGATVTAAAKKSGYSRRQAVRLLADEEFRARVSELRTSIVGRASGMLAARASRAIATLTKLLAAEEPAIRRRAARDLLDAGLRFLQVTDLDERMRKIEALVADQTGEP